MSVLDRLRELRKPYWGECREYWAPLEDMQAVDWSPSAIRARAVMLRRVEIASEPFSLRHSYKRMTAVVCAAIILTVPEMEWLRHVPSDAINPSGKENRLILWGS